MFFYRGMKYCCSLLLLLMSISSSAQKRNIELNGKIFDAFTRTGVEGTVVLLNEHDIPLDTVEAKATRDDARFKIYVPAEQATYQFKVSASGYKSQSLVYRIKHVARRFQIELPSFYLEKNDSDVYKSIGLEEVVVKGTKVRFTYRNDTLVYNASAFNIHSGSMLDALIRQLPGAELKQNGDIYVNGRKIDYLTLDGNDFFKGKNRIVLDNLPYYIVKELRVFEQDSEQNQFLDSHAARKDYIMDVRLKKEYATGYTVNMGGGIGSGHRYLGRLFAMRKTHHSNWSVFGNTNNTNETQLPNYGGDWNPERAVEGLVSTRQLGTYLTINEKDRKWKETMSATAKWKKNDASIQQTKYEYHSLGNLVSNIANSDVSRLSGLDFFNRFILQKPFKLFTTAKIDYSKVKDVSYSLLEMNALNKKYDGHTEKHSLNSSASVTYATQLPTGDNLNITIKGDYQKNRPNRNDEEYAVRYLLLDSTEIRNSSINKTRQESNYSFNGQYVMRFINNLLLSGQVTYEKRRTHADDIYKENSMTDLFNSRSFVNSANVYSTGLNLSYDYFHNQKSIRMSVYFPLEYTDERIRYNSLQLDTLAKRRELHIKPSYFFELNNDGLHMESSYSVDVQSPEMSIILPVVNNFEALTTYIYNPGLKNSVEHIFNFLIAKSNSNTGRSFSAGVTLTARKNALGRKLTFNPEKGHYTIGNGNVNGNWRMSVGLGYHFDWGGQKKISTDIKSSFDYLRNVDYVLSYYVPSDELSKVNTLLSDTKMVSYYRHKQLTLGTNVHFLWRKSMSIRTDFSGVSAFEYDYGCNVSYTIPQWGVDLSSDMKMFSRRGYTSASMNTDNLIWNVSVSKNVIKNKLNVKLVGFDILRNLSNYKFVVDAQGYTETIHNTAPSYVMLQALFMLSKK